MKDLATNVLHVPFVVAGRLVEGGDVEYRSRDMATPFVTPKLDLDSLVVPRQVAVPAFNVSTADVIDFLAETGKRLDIDSNPHLQAALEHMARIHPVGPRILRNCYAGLPQIFNGETLSFQVDAEFGGADVLDGWRVVMHPQERGLEGMADTAAIAVERQSAIRALPPRLVHVLPGNSPQAAAVSIVRGALTKGVHLLKMASNDLFTATAVLRTMAEIDPDHPTLRSFSAVYWRGGDETVESVLYRSQWFDKLVAWGGEGSIRSAQQYLGPGFELVAFDPKISISLIGREAFESEEQLRQVVDLAAQDVTLLNQDGCVTSRFQFVEASLEEADRYCEALSPLLAIDRPLGSGVAPPPPAEVRENVEVLRHLEPSYRVWGSYDGRGLVIRSEAPVGFHPDGKTVNVVPVASLADAIRYVTVATQTVGVFPAHRKLEVRDALAGAGAQRVVRLGRVGAFSPGLPHDGIYPLQRLVRWAADEDIAEVAGD